MAENKWRNFCWNEGEAWQEFHTVSDSRNTDPMSLLVVHLWETGKEFGAIAHETSGAAPVLYFATWEDQYRGKQHASGQTMEEALASREKHKAEMPKHVFTPNQLYALKPYNVQHASHHFLTVHMPEIGDSLRDDADEVMTKEKRFEIRDLVNMDFDGRRGWALQTVWFDGEPVMVVQNSGRDGDEYHRRFITDEVAFSNLIRYFRSLQKNDPENEAESVDPDVINVDMTEFYSHAFEEFYDIEKQQLKRPEQNFGTGVCAQVL